MLEAVSAGAIPVVPDDLCYREQYSSHCRYTSGDIEQAVNKIVVALAGELQVSNISPWLADSSAKQWQALYAS
ncbi:hypothetical protein A3759_06220 [Thalassolituus sp. HI0120]|nr:hypothetical protein A3759_06220 [Thalassolituus sp. HI0120]